VGVGLNDSERIVYEVLCGVFTPVSVFANTVKSDGRELCDVLVRLHDYALLVSVRDRKFNGGNDSSVEWARWSRETIGDKVKSLTKGARYLRSGENVAFLDPARTQELPEWVPRDRPKKIHKIIVGFSIPDSISDHKLGTEKTLRLQLIDEHKHDALFTLGVVKSEKEIVHVFDVEALRLVTRFADTPVEFDEYLCWREEVVAERNVFFANGEEDLVAAWMLKRFNYKPLVDLEDLRDEQGRLPVVGYVGTYAQFKRSAYFRWKQLANEKSGFWNALTAYVASAAFSTVYDNPERAAMYAALLAIESKYLRAFAWHELERKAREGEPAIDVLAVSSVVADLVYYFSVHHEDMSREDRMKNVEFMAHAIAGQRKCNCLTVGILAKDCLHHPAMAYAAPDGSPPVIHRDMSTIAVTINDALRWLATA
jgi:hypothetical protein